MITILKSAPDTPEGIHAVRLSRDMASTVVLIQNAVYFALSEIDVDLGNAVYALDEDLRLRGIDRFKKNIKTITYDGLVDLITTDKVAGAF